MIAICRNRRPSPTPSRRDATGARTTTSWDFDNRTTLIRLPSGVRNTMSYDPEGLRVKLEESGGTKKFVFDGQAYLLETDNSNVITATYSQEPTTYGNLISQRRGSTTSWSLFDATGSTTELLDDSQNVTDTWLYDAYGNIVSRTGTTATPFQWHGGVGFYWDFDSGQYYVRARRLDPKSAMFTTNDMAGFVEGMNLYKIYFVPNGIDPSGLGGFGPILDPFGFERLIEWLEYKFGKRRVQATLRFTGGASEITLGLAATAAPDPTPLTHGIGIVTVLHGIDTCIAALRELYTDLYSPTLTQEGIGGIAGALGASPEEAFAWGAAGDAAIGIGGSTWSGRTILPTATSMRAARAELARALVEGKTKGAVGAYAKLNPLSLRSLVFYGRSTRAGGARLQDIDPEVLALVSDFESKFAYGCSELRCMTSANQAGGGIRGGSITVIRVSDQKIMKACESCGPMMKKRAGIKSVGGYEN